MVTKDVVIRFVMKRMLLIPLLCMLAACGFVNNEIAPIRQVLVTEPPANKYLFVKDCNAVDVTTSKVKYTLR